MNSAKISGIVLGFLNDFLFIDKKNTFFKVSFSHFDENPSFLITQIVTSIV